MRDHKKTKIDKPSKWQTTVHADPKTEFLMRALAEVEGIAQRWEANQPGERRSLFLEGHYPFFDEQVQLILLERHPDQCLAYQGDPAYAVDAYIWAEQYAWIAYDDSPFKTCLFVEEFAGFYFVHDLRWFARLLVAIADVLERILRFAPERATHEARLQIWRNDRAQRPESEPKPLSWLSGTSFILKAAKKTRTNQANSIRASAGRINHKRRIIFGRWFPLWKAEIRHLRRQLLAWADRSG
jgi:hypothetical protein